MPRRHLLPLALTAGLAAAGPAAPAAAKGNLTIRGAGFGHGIGMSQYGAMGMAKHGWSYRRILSHYFRGTELGRAPANTVVRVLLQSPRVATFTGATNAGTKKLDPGRTYGARAAAGGKVALLSAAGKVLATFNPPMRVTNGADAPIKLRGTAGNGVTDGTYRGWFEFRPGALGEVLAINAIGLEQYVAGVVPNESPASWPMAALQAQAIAARSYAITTSRSGENGWDQYPDTRSQVYRGATSEQPSTNRAVNSTAGQVVTYDGRPITAYFFSTSGGRTENVENIWPGATPRPYLTSVDDPYDDVSPYHRWDPIVKTRAQVQSILAGLVKGRFRRIDILETGASPRIKRAAIVGTGGRTIVSGSTLQQRFGLRDTWITFNALVTEVEAPAKAPKPAKPSPSGDDADDVDNVSGGAAPAARAASLHRPRVVGALRPGTPGTLVVLQRRRADGTWVKAGETRLGTTRRYKIDLPGPGRYRVRADGLTGPVVRLR
ncbi:MAG TPA: SpoIID/LytB domain-containing protein [Capillimicrobium sp.]|nr:SpoIID/LytB domain-containing protein [Capillimicrobium sp.]